MRTLADRRERRPPGPHLSSCRSGDLAYVRTSAQRLLAVRQVARVDGSPAVCISDDRAYLKAHRKTRRERLVRWFAHAAYPYGSWAHDSPCTHFFFSLIFLLCTPRITQSDQTAVRPVWPCRKNEVLTLFSFTLCRWQKGAYTVCVCTNSLPSPLRKICMGGYMWVGVYKVTERWLCCWENNAL